MEETYSTKAIILKRSLFREVDGKIILYSFNKGKMELVVRGVCKLKSKLAGHLEPISFVDVMVVRGKIYDYIGAVSVKNSFFYIKNDLEKIKIVGRMIRIFNKIVKEKEEIDSEKLFLLLFEFLHKIDQKRFKIDNLELIYYFFVFKLLSILGYKPELYNCLICKNKIISNNNVFNLENGGLVCKSCNIFRAKNLQISDDCIKVLRLISNDKIEKILRIKCDDILSKEIISTVSSFLQYNNF